MISGYFDSNGRPTIHGMVVIPELDIWDGVDFLVDTGADMTCLHSADIEQLGIDLGLLRDVVGLQQSEVLAESRSIWSQRRGSPFSMSRTSTGS